MWEEIMVTKVYLTPTMFQHKKGGEKATWDFFFGNDVFKRNQSWDAEMSYIKKEA